MLAVFFNEKVLAPDFMCNVKHFRKDIVNFTVSEVNLLVVFGKKHFGAGINQKGRE